MSKRTLSCFSAISGTLSEDIRKLLLPGDIKLQKKAVAPCLWFSGEYSLNRDAYSIINFRLIQDVINITKHQIVNFDWFVAKVYWLRAGLSGDRIPVGATFFAHVQPGPGSHPASRTMGTGSFPGVKRPERGADHPPPSSVEVKRVYSYTSIPPLGFRVC
jgi:hypothetical protein